MSLPIFIHTSSDFFFKNIKYVNFLPWFSCILLCFIQIIMYRTLQQSLKFFMWTRVVRSVFAERVCVLPKDDLVCKKYFHGEQSDPGVFTKILRNWGSEKFFWKQNVSNVQKQKLWFQWPIYDGVISSFNETVDLFSYWRTLLRVEFNEGLFRCFTVGWILAKCHLILWLQPLMGVLCHVVFFEEVLLLSQKPRRKRAKTVNFQKNIAPTNNRIQTTETNR